MDASLSFAAYLGGGGLAAHQQPGSSCLTGQALLPRKKQHPKREKEGSTKVRRDEANVGGRFGTNRGIFRTDQESIRPALEVSRDPELMRYPSHDSRLRPCILLYATYGGTEAALLDMRRVLAYELACAPSVLGAPRCPSSRGLTLGESPARADCLPHRVSSAENLRVLRISAREKGDSASCRRGLGASPCKGERGRGRSLHGRALRSGWCGFEGRARSRSFASLRMTTKEQATATATTEAGPSLRSG